jgi:hypothetical protein
MFGQDDKECGPGDEQEAKSSPMQAKLLQKIIEMLTGLPDQEKKPEGAVEIELAGMTPDGPKNKIG